MSIDEKPKRKAPAAWVEAGKKHRWKKGQSGNASQLIPEQLRPFLWEKGGPSPNPGGRAKSKVLSQALRRRLEDLVPADPLNRTFAEVIADIWICRAAKGDVRAAEAVASRCEGSPMSSLVVSASVEMANAERAANVLEKLKGLRDQEGVES